MDPPLVVDGVWGLLAYRSKSWGRCMRWRRGPPRWSAPPWMLSACRSWKQRSPPWPHQMPAGGVRPCMPDALLSPSTPCCMCMTVRPEHCCCACCV